VAWRTRAGLPRCSGMLGVVTRVRQGFGHRPPSPPPGWCLAPVGVLGRNYLVPVLTLAPSPDLPGRWSALPRESPSSAGTADSGLPSRLLPAVSSAAGVLSHQLLGPFCRPLGCCRCGWLRGLWPGLQWSWLVGWRCR
jgi:hypothetical protein